jgi:hypothetical protein
LPFSTSTSMRRWPSILVMGSIRIRWPIIIFLSFGIGFHTRIFVL